MSNATQVFGSDWETVELTVSAPDVRVGGHFLAARQVLHFAVCPVCYSLVVSKGDSLREHSLVLHGTPV